MSVQSTIKRKTAPDIRARKNGEPIVMLTSYHAHTAALVDRYCDIILILRRAACGHPCRIPPARPRPRSRGSGDLQHRYQSGEQIEQLCAAGEQVGKTS